MVSFHKALAESPRNAELEASSKKRKWEDQSLPVEFFNAQTEAEKRKSTSDNRQLYPSVCVYNVLSNFLEPIAKYMHKMLIYFFDLLNAVKDKYEHARGPKE